MEWIFILYLVIFFFNQNRVLSAQINVTTKYAHHYRFHFTDGWIAVHSIAKALASWFSHSQLHWQCHWQFIHVSNSLGYLFIYSVSFYHTLFRSLGVYNIKRLDSSFVGSLSFASRLENSLYLSHSGLCVRVIMFNKKSFNSNWFISFSKMKWDCFI